MNLWLGQLKPFYTKWSKNMQMNVPRIKRTMLLFVSILAGLCLFYIVTNLIVYVTLLNADFHEKLLAGEEMFSYINSITQKIANNLSISPNMVQSNLRSIIRGLINYIKGTENLLPDIRLDNDILNLTALGSSMNNYVDKVNLSTVLLFSKRTYVSDSLTVLRMLFECLKTAFNIITLFFILLIIIMIIIIKKNRNMTKYWQLLICFPGFLCLISALIIFLYSKNRLPEMIYALFLQIDISQDIKVNLAHMLTSYVRKCLNYAAFYIILSGAVLILVSILMPTSSISQINKKPSLSKSSTFLFITVLVTVLLIQKVGNFKEDYKINDFIALTSRIREYGSAAPVILAEDENIYSLQVRVIDENSGQPIQGMKVILIHNSIYEDYIDYNNCTNASSVDSDNSVNNDNPVMIKESITDSNGIANFFIDNEFFYLKTVPSNSNNSHYLPVSFPFNMKTTVNNTITVYMSHIP
ncbi:MAG TPA: hypothetical protein GX527_07750 [Clostridiaceae bacterium]|nr:hypothetical protein [Clostridiaceae bacterium]